MVGCSEIIQRNKCLAKDIYQEYFSYRYVSSRGTKLEEGGHDYPSACPRNLFASQMSVAHPKWKNERIVAAASPLHCPGPHSLHWWLWQGTRPEEHSSGFPSASPRSSLAAQLKMTLPRKKKNQSSGTSPQSHTSPVSEMQHCTLKNHTANVTMMKQCRLSPGLKN